MRNPESKILQPLEKATRHSVEIMLDTFKCCSLGLGTQSLLRGPAATSLLLKDTMLLLPLLPAPSLCSCNPHSHQIRELNQLEVSLAPNQTIKHP